MSNSYFTSDLHLGHSKIIQYCNRPFADVSEMNETIIDNWNKKVGRNDNVYLIGDVSFLRPETTVSFLKRMKGRKYLVRGNHDKKMDESVINEFEWVKDLAEIYIQDSEAEKGRQMIVLCHYAMRVWNKAHHGAWHLHGHSHGTLPDDPNSLSIDVGVDNHNFAPISYQEIKEIMATKRFRPIDHHSEADNI